MNNPWNDDPHRRSGRTTMDALHIVQLSLDNPGEWVSIDDHYQKDGSGDRYLLNLVVRVFNALNVQFQSSGLAVRTMGPPQPYIYPAAEEAAKAARKYRF